MEYEKEKKILNVLKKEILLEKDYQKQILLINDYYNILAYLDKLGIIDAVKEINNLPINIDHYHNQLKKEKIAYCQEFIDNFDIINDLTNKMLSLYKNYPLKQCDAIYCNPIDIKEGMDLVYEFFYSLNDDFYNLFLQLNHEQRISFKGYIFEEGMTYNASFKNGEFIILRKDSQEFDYEFLSTLVHEVGHCYEFEIAKNNSHIFPLYLLAEVSSLVLQKLFDDYVINNHSYHEKALYSQMVGYSILYERCLVNDFVNKSILSDDVESLDYELGDFNILNNERTANYINSSSRKAIFDYPPSLENYLYVISDIVANNFVNIYHNDKKEMFKLFKDFLINARFTPFSTNINRYGFDYDILENSLSKIYSYQLKIKNPFNS